MKNTMPSVCAVVVCLAGLPVATPETVTASETIPEAIVRIQDAFEHPDIGDRPRLLEEAVTLALQNPSENVRSRVYGVLRSSPFEVDYLDFDTASKNCRDSFVRYCLAEPIDRFELQRDPRDTRLHVYRLAIVDGQVVLPRGTRFSRLQAIEWAAAEGASELLPTIDEYYPLLSNADRERYPIEQVHLDIELRKESRDWFEGLKVAVDRVSSLPGDEFIARMASDPNFRSVVISLGKGACAPPLKDWQIEPCNRMRYLSEYHRDRDRTLDHGSGGVIAEDSSTGDENHWRRALLASVWPKPE